MRSDDASWHAMEPADLPGVAALAGSIHTLSERTEVLEEKFMLYRRGCFALKQDGKLLGYGFCHPWKLDVIPGLDTFLEALPSAPDCLYIDDIAILSAGSSKPRLCDELGRRDHRIGPQRVGVDIGACIGLRDPDAVDASRLFCRCRIGA